MKRPGGVSGKGVFTDNRKGAANFCIYCAEQANTREHLPSKAFLLSPFPDNLSVVPACLNCNNGYSEDEVYVSSFLYKLNMYVYSNKNDDCNSENKYSYKIENVNNEVMYSYDESRIVRILVKLAKGHVGYILDYLTFSSQVRIWYDFKFNLTNSDQEIFNSMQMVSDIAEEIGSRGNNIMITPDGGAYTIYSWTVVQANTYRYMVYRCEQSVCVRIVINELLYAEVEFLDS